MIYLAAPYADPDPAVREARFKAACQVSLQIARRTRSAVYCPVIALHPLDTIGLPTDWDTWGVPHAEMLGLSSEIIVLTLPGWQESPEVAADLRLARALRRFAGFQNYP
jgi:hypothetical protein